MRLTEVGIRFCIQVVGRLDEGVLRSPAVSLKDQIGKHGASDGDRNEHCHEYDDEDLVDKDETAVFPDNSHNGHNANNNDNG